MYLVIYGSNLYTLRGILIVLLSGCPFGLNVPSARRIIETSGTVIKIFSSALLGTFCSSDPSVEPVHSFWASDNEALCPLMVQHRKTSQFCPRIRNTITALFLNPCPFDCLNNLVFYWRK